jgi:broad specificity phosphatase PhoE
VATSLSAGRRHCPARLVLIRHGESEGNVANEAALSSGAERLVFDVRDPDVRLSDNGVAQARAVGDWVADLPEEERPTVVLTSPYQRAAQTATEAMSTVPKESRAELIVDERLRERDLGQMDGLTGAGIRANYPEEAARRKKLGKFYYRPPGGESWTDVALRVRSALNDIRSDFDDERVWLFSHQAVIMSFRYVLEHLDEESVLRADRESPLGNCSLTTYERKDGGLHLVSYGDTTAVDRGAAAVTHEPKEAGRGEQGV